MIFNISSVLCVVVVAAGVLWDISEELQNLCKLQLSCFSGGPVCVLPSHPFQCLISVLCLCSLKGNLNNWLTGERYREGQVSKCLLSRSAFVQSCQPWDKLSLNFHPHLHILISCTCKCWGFPLPYLGFHCSSVVGSRYQWFSLFFLHWFWEARCWWWALHWGNNYGVCTGEEVVSVQGGGWLSVCMLVCLRL